MALERIAEPETRPINQAKMVKTYAQGLSFGAEHRYMSKIGLPEFFNQLPLTQQIAFLNGVKKAEYEFRNRSYVTI